MANGTDGITIKDSVLNTTSASVLKARSNEQIMKAIWNDASQEFQYRIPDPTQGSIAETFNALLDSRFIAQRNEFVDILVNRIGDVVFRSKVWNNPLAALKRGMMRYGDTVEEIAVGLLKAKRFDPNQCYTDVFACNKPEVFANYHRINRQDRYDLTVNESLLRRAFVDEYGISRMLESVMNTPYNSDAFDEFLIMKRLFAEFDRIGGFYKVNVPTVTDATQGEARRTAAAIITEKIRAIAGDMGFFSGKFNAQGVPTFTNPGEFILITTPKYNALLDVNVIAQAFNVSAAELNFRTILIDDFGIDGAVALLCDQDFFMCLDTLLEFRSIENPKGLAWNYFLHHWGVYSLSTFINAVLFTEEAGTTETIPDITVDEVVVTIAPEKDGTIPEYAPLGGRLRLVATSTGTITPETEGYTVPQAVVWSISATDGKPLSELTFIDPEGVLHVGQAETNTKLTVKAVSTYIDPTKPIGEQTYKEGTLVVGIGEPVPVEDGNE